MDKAAIKQKVCEAIAAHRADIEAISEAILAEPELGFKEVKTSRKVQEALERLGIEFTAGHGITGVKARMKGRNSKRTVAMLAELDAIVCRNHRNADPVTGAAHCCGHNIQIANMIAVACGLRDVMSELDGDVVLFAVPAEEYVEIDWRNAQRDEGRLKYLGGKQQLIAEGAFEDIDMAMQMHVASGDEFNLGASSNGFIGKLIEYHGRPAHAAFAPEEGINALNAAMMGVMGVNAIRETFRDQDHVRFHPIINAGGDLVNVIPDYVKMESYVRASNIDAMARYNKAVDRALRAGGDAIGAKCRRTLRQGEGHARRTQLGLDRHGRRLAPHARHPPLGRLRRRRSPRRRLRASRPRGRLHPHPAGPGPHDRRPARRRRAEGRRNLHGLQAPA